MEDAKTGAVSCSSVRRRQQGTVLANSSAESTAAMLIDRVSQPSADDVSRNVGPKKISQQITKVGGGCKANEIFRESYPQQHRRQRLRAFQRILVLAECNFQSPRFRSHKITHFRCMRERSYHA